MNIIYTLIFGFYFLISKNKKSYFSFMPNKLRKSIDKDLNDSCIESLSDSTNSDDLD